MSLLNSALSAVLQVIVLAGIPFALYWLYHRLRHKRTFPEVAARAGLQLGKPRYLLYSAAIATVGILAIVIWSPPLEPLTREGSAQSRFVGLGISWQVIVMALLHGAIQTAFAEEVLFRGLIAGSLGRRLPLLWANLIQALIFFLPHVLILLVAPELAMILPLVFIAALLNGWIRIKSDSILGPWIMHGAGNVAMALMVAVRTAA